MDFDVMVIGSGQAGVPLAARLAAEGRRVAIVEASELGGTCINAGCTPTKTMIASARAAHVARNAGRLGVRTRGVRVNLVAVVDRKDEIVRQWREGVRKRLERAGANLTLIQGRARFVGERQIEVKRERHRGEVVIINTGTRPASPPIPGLDGVRWLDNHTVMRLRRLPAHLLVLGGGYIGCEFAQMFRRFGSQVSLVELAEHILPNEDPEVAGTLEEVFRNEGIALHVGRRAAAASKQDRRIALDLDDATRLEGSHLLVAAGRRPNTDRLNCRAAGVELDGRGYILADDHYRTSAEAVYAVGDVLGPFPQFTHTSWDDHRILFDLLTGRGTRGRSGRVIPFTVFTDPQVARVGLTEREAKAQGIACEAATMPFGYIARAVETDEPAGILKVLLDPATEQILGAAIVGIEAGELIHVFTVLMQAGASARAIVDAEFVHPTLSEGVQTLVMRLDRYRI